MQIDRNNTESLLFSPTVLQGILGTLDQGVALFDASRRLVAATPALRAGFGFPEDVIKVGASCYSIFRFLADRGDYSPGDPAELTENRLRVVWSGTPSRVEFLVRGTVWYEIAVRPFAGGGILITYIDIQ